MPLPENAEGEPKGQLCHPLHAAIPAETQQPSAGSGTIHVCQLWERLRPRASTTAALGTTLLPAQSLHPQGAHPPTHLTPENVGGMAAQPRQTSLGDRAAQILRLLQEQFFSSTAYSAARGEQPHLLLNRTQIHLMLPLSGKGTGWLEHAPSICCVGVIQAWQGCCKALRWFIISRPRAKT